MLLPIPEVKPLTILPGSDIFQVETFRIGIGCAPFAADHNIVAWVGPEVIVVAHGIGLVFPAPGNVKVIVEQQEPSWSLTLAIPEHGKHDMAISEARYGVVSISIGLL